MKKKKNTYQQLETCRISSPCHSCCCCCDRRFDTLSDLRVGQVWWCWCVVVAVVAVVVEVVRLSPWSPVELVELIVVAKQKISKG